MSEQVAVVSKGRKPAVGAFGLPGHWFVHRTPTLGVPVESVGLPDGKKPSVLHLRSTSTGISLLQSLGMKLNVQVVQQGKGVQKEDRMKGQKKSHSLIEVMLSCSSSLVSWLQESAKALSVGLVCYSTIISVCTYALPLPGVWNW